MVSLYVCFKNKLSATCMLKMFDLTLLYNLVSGFPSLIVFDSLFNLNWEKTVGGSQTEIAQSIIESTDNNLLAVGYSFSSDFDVTESYSLVNFWVVKLKFCLDQYFADIDGDGFGNLFSDSLAW